MSGLVEKVKGVVRSRSKHRQTDSLDSTGPRTSSDQYVLAPETSNQRNSTQESRRGRNSPLQNGLEGTTRNLAAMNMSDQSPSVTTTTKTTPNGSAQVKTLPPLPSNANQTIENARAQIGTSNGQFHKEMPLNRGMSGDITSPRTPTHQRNMSGSIGGSGSQNISPEIVPDRDSSMKRKPLPSMRTDNKPHVLHPKGPRSPPGHRYSRSTDVAPNDLSPLVPHFTTRSAASPTSPTFSSSGGDNNGVPGETRDRHLRLPAHFDLSNTEHTQVDTKVMPAVTAENIHIQKTEIITKAIHKDIHIHHHYTYIQPIPVLEVLPARHFRLDPTTGEKTEIPAPPGYKLPAHLQPRKAEDYSHLRQTTRHYVVNEDYPNGHLESPRHEDDVSNMERQPDEHQNGTTHV